MALWYVQERLKNPFLVDDNGLVHFIHSSTHRITTRGLQMCVGLPFDVFVLASVHLGSKV